MVTPLMTSKELASRARISLRQIHWWLRQGVMTCRHRRGHAWLYTADEAFRALMVRELLARGFRCSRIRRMKLRPPTGADYLVIYGRYGSERLAWRRGIQAAIQLSSLVRSGVFLISICDLREELVRSGDAAEQPPVRRFVAA